MRFTRLAVTFATVLLGTAGYATASGHGISRTRAGWSATSDVTGVRAEFASGGTTLRVAGAPRSYVRLAAVAAGYAGDLQPLTQPAAPRVRGGRASFDRGSVTEWYVNGPTGLEQGFSVRRPVGPRAGSIVVQLATAGALVPSAPVGGRQLLLTHHGRVVLTERDLGVTDARGHRLAAHFTARGSRFSIVVDVRGAVFPLRIDPLIQSAQITPPAGADNSFGGFGQTVAIDGSTAVVGDSSERVDGVTTGAAYVFTRSNGVWTEAAELTPSDGETGGQFGASVAISGTTIVVGAPRATVGGDCGHVFPPCSMGAVYVFSEPSPGGWVDATQTAKLTPTQQAAAYFGSYVAIQGNTIVGTAPDVGDLGPYLGNPSSGYAEGAAYVFVEPGTQWVSTSTPTTTLSSGTTNTNFLLGNGGVAMFGSTIALTSDGGTYTTTAQADVFTAPAGGWTQESFDDDYAALTDANAPSELTFDGPPAFSADGSTIAWPNFAGDHDAGEVLVYQEPTAGWTSMTQTATLTASNASSGSETLGGFLAFVGDTVYVSPSGVNGAPLGPGYYYTEPPTGWANMTETGTFQDSADAKITSLASDSTQVMAGTAAGAYVFSAGLGLSVGNASAVEPTGADATLSFPVTLSSPASTDVSVDYQTSDGSALAGHDYDAASGTLTIPAGSTAASIPVTIHDVGPEADKSFTVKLSSASPSQVTLSQATATGTIDGRGVLGVTVKWLQNGNPASLTSPGQSAQADTIQLADSSGKPVPQDLTAQVTVTNTGTVTQQNVSIKGTPALSYHNPAAGVGLVPASVTAGPTPSGTLPNLASGASTTVSYTVHVTGEGVFDLSVQALSSDAGTQDTNVSNGVSTFTVLGAGLKIDWSMPPRVAQSIENLSTSEATRGLPPAGFVTPSSWLVNLHLVDGTTPVTSCPVGVSYSWVVTPPAGAQVITQPQDGCSTSMSVSALGNYTVTATRLNDTTGGYVPTTAAPVTQTVAVKDLLVVGLGDSNASGEGVGPFYYPQCDRGVASYQYQAAAALEHLVQPHTSVTFVSAACSGATTQNLVDADYAGINGDTLLPPQIGSVEQLLSEHGSAPARSVDAAMVSIGINNTGFGPFLNYCVKHPPILASGGLPCFQQPVKRSVNGSGQVTWTGASGAPTLDSGVRGLIAGLPQRYDEVAGALQGLVSPNRVYLSQYPSETTDEDGNLCSGLNSALVTPVWGWLATTGSLLNSAVAAGAGAHGWHTIAVPPQVYSGHGYCAEDPWFVTISAAAGAHNLNGSFHANATGAAVTAGVALADICPAIAPDPTACAGISATSADGPTGSDGVVSAGTLAASNGSTASVPVEASCSTAQTSICSVSATATAGSATAGASRLATSRRRRPAAPVLARGRLTLAPGSSKSLTLRLTAAGRKDLRAHRSLRIVVTVRSTGRHRATVRKKFALKLVLVHPKRSHPARRGHDSVSRGW